MIDVAETVYLVADSTKIGKGALASLGALSLIDFIITDSGIGKDHLQLFRDHDIKIITAQL
jgi:DeoR/GlpR family transcriptional regulator of sugar metabolism